MAGQLEAFLQAAAPAGAGANGANGASGLNGAAAGAPSWWDPTNPYSLRTDIADLLNESVLPPPAAAQPKPPAQG